MIKNRLDFKLINLAILCFILFLLYNTRSLWIGIFSLIWEIVMPFLAAFTIAYAFYPLLAFLVKRKVPKILAVFIILVLISAVVIFTGILIAPILFDQLVSLFNSIIAFLKNVSTGGDINFGPLQESLSGSFNEIIGTLGKYVSDGAISFINVSLGVISTTVIVLALFVYFLIDMDVIRLKIKEYLQKKSRKTFTYFKTLDGEMKSYLNGFVKIMFITLIEYTVAYYIIGHPNALLLGFLAVLGGLIPFFGGMAVNVIAAITAFAASPDPSLFIKTCVVFLILSNIDGYIINPAVYGKTNKMHPIIIILSVFAGGILFGITGIIISLPLAIIIFATYKYYRLDIEDKIEDMKEQNQKNKPKKKKELKSHETK